MPLKILEVHFNWGGPQNLGVRSGCLCLSRLLSRCGAARIFGHGGHFSRQAQGHKADRLWWSKVDFSVGAVILRNADFVAGAVLWTWW